MFNDELWHYLRHLLASLLRYALYGALLLAIAAVLLQGLFILLGQTAQPALSAFWRTTGSWALVGSLFGALMGLIYGLLTAGAR